MQGRANLLQTEFNGAFQPGSQPKAFFDIEKSQFEQKNRWLEKTTLTKIQKQPELNRAFQPGRQPGAFLDILKKADLNKKIDGWNTQ